MVKLLNFGQIICKTITITIKVKYEYEENSDDDCDDFRIEHERQRTGLAG